MDIELINRDINIYLDKYTRFMSKRVYITKMMYDKFVSLYDYIYEEANSSIVNYNNDIKYKKLLEIKNNGMKLVKLHNKKYLEDLYKKENNFFGDNLTKSQKLGIMCEEDNIFMIVDKDKEKVNVINNKLSYLINSCNIKNDDICIIVPNYMEDKIIDMGATIYDYREFAKYVSNQDKNIIDNKDKYNIISKYIKDILYKDRVKFNKFYECFHDKLYFNKDYLDFETFNDYHNYMFKRMYLNSHMSMKEFVSYKTMEKKKRLRTIKGERCTNEFIVDIANCLYENTVNYKIIQDNVDEYIYIDNIEFSNVIRYYDKECNVSNGFLEVINLYSSYKDNSNCLDNLIYELIKRRYPIEKRDIKEVYNELKNDITDSYFMKFIDNLAVPFINKIKSNRYSCEYLMNIKCNKDMNDKFMVMMDFYNYYCKWLNDNNSVDNYDLVNTIKSSNIKYKHLVMYDSDNIFDKYDIDNNSNIKIFCIKNNCDFKYGNMFSSASLLNDFKKYLKENKLIDIAYVYYKYDELDDIVRNFTINNMSKFSYIINDSNNLKKKVLVYIYDDDIRLKTLTNKRYLMDCIIDTIYNKNKKIMIMGASDKDIDEYISGNYFSYGSDNKIINNNHKDIVIDYLNMDSSLMCMYDVGIIINPMDEKYGFNYCIDNEDVIRVLSDSDIDNYYWEKKLFYMAVSRVKNKLYVMCPKSGVSLYVKNILNNNEVKIKKEIYKVL